MAMSRLLSRQMLPSMVTSVGSSGGKPSSRSGPPSGGTSLVPACLAYLQRQAGDSVQGSKLSWSCENR